MGGGFVRFYFKDHVISGDTEEYLIKNLGAENLNGLQVPREALNCSWDYPHNLSQFTSLFHVCECMCV